MLSRRISTMSDPSLIDIDDSTAVSPTRKASSAAGLSPLRVRGLTGRGLRRVRHGGRVRRNEDGWPIGLGLRGRKRKGRRYAWRAVCTAQWIRHCRALAVTLAACKHAVCQQSSWHKVDCHGSRGGNVQSPCPVLVRQAVSDGRRGCDRNVASRIRTHDPHQTSRSAESTPLGMSGGLENSVRRHAHHARAQR